MRAWDYTPAECVDMISAFSERRKNHMQCLSSIAYGHVSLTGRAFSGKSGSIPEIYEVFPFWSEEEIMKSKAEKFKAQLYKYGHTKEG